MVKSYDVVVVGSGSGGQTAAYTLMEYGLSVAVVENSATPGGICALAGCQAKKWFYEATETMARARHLAGKGLIRPPELDWSVIRDQKRAFTEPIPDATRSGLKGSGIDFIPGTAAFKDATTLMVNGDPVQGKYIVLATGAHPMALPFAGAEHLITSSDFLELDRLPPRIVFIGGGFISFEFAHFAARIYDTPHQINILEVSERPLGPFDKDMVEELVQSSIADGIGIRCEVNITAVEKNGDEFFIHFENGPPLVADLVINGAGRSPAIDDLDLESAGVEYSRSGIAVDQAMRSSVETIFAVGDCAHSIQLARVADREGLTAARNILAAKGEGGEDKISYAEVPAVLFTYPQLAMIGETEDQLIDKKVRYWKNMDTELSWPTYRRVGLRRAAFKILVDENDLLLGAHILSDNATGIINTFRMAMLHNIDIKQLRQHSIMSPYPSRESDIVYMLDPLVE